MFFTCFALILVPFLRIPFKSTEAYQLKQHGPFFKPVLICSGIVLVAFFAESGVESWGAIHIERSLNGGPAQGAMGPVSLGLTMAFGRFSGQFFVNKFSEFKVILWGIIGSALGIIMATFGWQLLAAYIGFGIFGLGISVVGPIGLLLVGRAVHPSRRVEAIGRVAAINFSGFCFAPALIGILSQLFGLRIAFACLGAILLLALFFVLNFFMNYGRSLD